MRSVRFATREVIMIGADMSFCVGRVRQKAGADVLMRDFKIFIQMCQIKMYRCEIFRKDNIMQKKDCTKRRFLKIQCVVCCFCIAAILFTAVIGSNNKACFDNNVFGAIGNAYSAGDENVRIASFNLLADGVAFGGERSEGRADGVSKLFCAVNADVIALQEVSRWWRCSIKEKTDYVFADGFGGEICGIMTAVAYNPISVELLRYGGDLLPSASNPLLRRAVWGVFRQKSSQRIFAVVCTHFNLNEGDISPGLLQAERVAELSRDIHDKYDCSVITLGDFNAKSRGAVSYRTSAVYEVMSLKMSDIRNFDCAKSCGMLRGVTNGGFDHIFMVGSAEIREYAVLSQKELKYLSDHYMIFADFVF